MELVGLIGGMAPESTVDYYRQIIAEYCSRNNGASHPRILITSVDLQLVIPLFNASKYHELADVLTAEADRLERAGASFGAITSNTTHIAYDEVTRRSKLPLISIVEVTCQEAARRGIRRPLLIGTRFLMNAPLYPDVFARAGLEILLPSEPDQDTIHTRYMGEFVNGVFTPESRAALIAAAERGRDELGADALILGGTEIPLLLRGTTIDGMPLLDTTKIHVTAIVDRLCDD